MITRPRMRPWMAALIACTVLPACSTLSGPPASPVQHSLQEAASASAHASAQTPAPPPAAVQDALLPPLKVDLGGGTSTKAESRFDLKVHDAPARQFFMSLVEGTPYNMVVSPDVKGKVSLQLKNVTVRDVLNAARDAYGYEYRRTATGFEVRAPQLETRIFQVNYLDISRRGRSETSVSSGQITENSNAVQGGTGGMGPTAITGGSNVTTQQASRIETDSDSDVWKDLTSALHAIVGDKGGRNVVVSPDSGVVVVRAMPSELREVARFLRTVQGSLQRQVILEAKILEVTLNSGFQSGINWAALSEVGAGKSLLFGQTGGGTIFNGSGSEISGNTGTLDPNNYSPVQGTNTSAFGGVFSLAANLNDFNAFIELLKTQGKVHVLSSPRVATVNNQKAIIKVGTDEFFVTNVSSTSIIGTTSSQSPNITLTPFFSGIALDVTPQINQHGGVTLHIHPTVSEVKDQTKTITVAGQQQTLPLALSSVRESDSVVYARSGQVVVIGGLMQNQRNVNHAGTPFLGDLPYVGSLFRHTKTSTTKSELVILLKPVVVAGDGTWHDALQQSAARMKALDEDHSEGLQGSVRDLLGN